MALTCKICKEEIQVNEIMVAHQPRPTQFRVYHIICYLIVVLDFVLVPPSIPPEKPTKDR